jgi:hypothetical protein
MNPDRPVDSVDKDGFNYYPLAKQLAPHLLLKSGDPSLVVGVEAPWGSGKTSFLNLTRLALNEKESSALVLNYRPWVYSTVDSLILGFCVQIASQLSISNAPNYKRISAALFGFSQALRPLRWIPGSEPIMAGVEMALGTAAAVTKTAAELETLDISNAKAKVQEALDQVGKPVIVFIDDVDRLPPLEIRLLFQFLKAVADFNGVSYLVAYDPIPVEQALSYDGKLDGKEYLKKFIQLPIRLPRLSRLLMRRFLAETAVDVHGANNSSLSEGEVKELVAVATSDLMLTCLKTPRDVVRCFNILRLRLPDYHGELQLSALLKFILLELICPEAIEFIRSHSALFIGSFSTHPEFASSGNSYLASIFHREEERKSEREGFYSSLPENERDTAQLLVNSLFPAVHGRLETNVLSAQSSHGLIKLLYGATSPMAFSVAEAKQFLSGESRVEILQDKVSAGVFREWLYFLSSLTDETEVVDPSGVASVLIETLTTTVFINDDQQENNLRLLVDYLWQLLLKSSDVDEQVAFVENVISYHQFLHISHLLVLHLARDAGLWKNGEAYPIDQPIKNAANTTSIPGVAIIALEQEWRKAVRSEANNGTLHDQQGLFSILFRWGQFPNNDYSERQDYIKSFCESNDAIVLLQKSGFTNDPSSLDKLLVASDSILSSLKRYDSEQDFREQAINYITHLQTKKASLASHSAPQSDANLAEEAQDPS